MQMIYNSDSYVVVQFDPPAAEQEAQVIAQADPDEADVVQVTQTGSSAVARTGFEIVDKFSRKEVYLDGLLAERFQAGVRDLVERGASTEEALDEFIAGFAQCAQQPVVLH